MVDSDAILQSDIGKADGLKHVWEAPELRIIRAGAAEVGPNPVNPEGQFAQGS